MNTKKQATLAASAVTAVSADLAKDHVQGIFAAFHAEGRHLIGTTAGGEDVKVTQYVNGGKGLDSEEVASKLADKLNEDTMLANLMGIALQFDFKVDGYAERGVEPQREAA
jgi:hypothetical protein